jgi:site-specific DNA recombinase
MAARKTRRGWPGRIAGHSLDIAGRTADAYFRVSFNPDAEEQKSIEQQRDDYDGWIEGVRHKSVIVGRQYADDDRSASRFATRQREEFAKLRADIAAGRLDGHVLYFWSSSRQTRGDIPLDELAAESEAHGIVWCTGGMILNPANDDDMMIAGFHNLIDKQYSARLAKDVTRGKADAARKGTPATAPLYGYRRIYRTDGDGQPVLIKGRLVIERDEAIEPAASIVREIYTRIERGDTLAMIARDLEDRRVPAPRHPRKCTSCGYLLGKDKRCPHGHVQDLCQWRASAVRFIATNIQYTGVRIYQADSARLDDRRRAVLTGEDGKPVPVKWAAMVTDEQYWRVQGILADNSRVRYRSPGRGGSRPDGESHGRPYVMVPTARCYNCGAALGGHSERNGNFYKCRERGCVSIKAEWLEAYAENRLVSWLVLPEVRTRIWGTQEDADAQQAEARGELERLNVELEEVRQLAERGDLSPVLASRMEAAKLAAIESASARLAPHASIVLDMMGADAADRWVALKAERPHAARQLMAEVCTIYVHPGKRGGGKTRPFDESRVEWHWKIGPDASAGRTREGCSERLAERRNALSSAREAAADLLRADPSLADARIGRKAGLSYGAVAKVRARLEAAGEITDPGYRTGNDGKRYYGTGNGKPGSPRVMRIEATRRPVTRLPRDPAEIRELAQAWADRRARNA